jgi:hypothetical protein
VVFFFICTGVAEMEYIIDYKIPKFYTGDIRSTLNIIDKRKVNTLVTLHNIRDYYELHTFADGYIGVFSERSNKYILPHIGKKRSTYFKYSFRTNENKTKQIFMHRLIGFAWLDGWDIDKFIDHKNGDKLQNRIENLEWVTYQENIRRAIVNGLWSMNVTNSLSHDQIEIIFKMVELGFNETIIAKKFGVTQPCISQILNGKRWKTHPSTIAYLSNLKATS